MFEWDETKNQANIEKHGVSFATASRIFEGVVFSVIDDRRDYGETREISIGRIGGATFLTVVHTDRDGNIRIISARPAKRGERHRYEEAIREGNDRGRSGGGEG
ncbi:BrnT family toxin [Aurantimonas sp. A3-2-R12]|uniref:BrnT family toxin n=1 Tax=Aurantimonas sp. A3-2-R12 TaxID=3114362 RepID=UPI002E17E5E0|nr:BrnT family toxin [Aurantimonas sp. A3-2-R12]